MIILATYINQALFTPNLVNVLVNFSFHNEVYLFTENEKFTINVKQLKQ